MLEVEITKDFDYEALNADGIDTNGVVAAKDNSDAVKKIRAMGLFPTRVREVKHPETYSSYLEYLSEVIGDALIEWGKKLKGENDV